MEGYKKIVDEEEYNTVLEENEYVFVIYSASWCGPCKSLKKMLGEDYLSYPHPIVVVDVDELEELAVGVNGLPTMVGFHKKNEFIRTVGYDKKKIQQILDNVLQDDDGTTSN